MNKFRNPIGKRLIREFKVNVGRYLAIALIFITMVSVIGGFLTAANNVRKTLDNGLEMSRVEDGQFTVNSSIAPDVMESIKELGLTIESIPYFEYEYDNIFTLRIFENRKLMNLPIVHEGRLASEDGEITIDKLYAENIGVSVGDAFRINNKDYIITGLIWVPDYSSPYKKSSDIIQDAAHFGIALIDTKAFQAFKDPQLTYSYAFRYNDRSQSKSMISDEILKLLVQNNIETTNFVLSDENLAISFVKTDLGSDVPMMMAFLVVMMVILAFVFTIIIDHTIEHESGVIGALMSTGMKKNELIRHYLALPLITTIVSGIVGATIGTLITNQFFNNMYHSAYSLPPVTNKFDLASTMITTVLPIVTMLMINLMLLFKRLSIMPVRFLRGELKKARNKRAMKLPNLPFIGRFRLRIILTNKGSYSLLLVGILFANFILMMGLILKPTIENYISETSKNSIAKFQYILKIPYEVNDDNIEKFSIKPMSYYDKAIDKKFDVSIIGIQNNSIFITTPIPSGSVLLSQDFMKKYGFNNDDEIILETATGDQISVSISGYYPYSAGFAVMMNIDEMNRLVNNEQGYFNGYFTEYELDIEPDIIATTITPEILKGAGEQMLTSFSQLVSICVFAATIVFLVLISLLTKLVLDRNAHNISLMKVLGYNNMELRKIFLSTTTAIVIVSLIVTMSLNKIGVELMYTQMMFRQMSGFMTVVFPWWVYLIMFGIGITCYTVVNFLLIKKIEKIKMEEALKVRE